MCFYCDCLRHGEKISVIETNLKLRGPKRVGISVHIPILINFIIVILKLLMKCMLGVQHSFLPFISPIFLSSRWWSAEQKLVIYTYLNSLYTVYTVGTCKKLKMMRSISWQQNNLTISNVVFGPTCMSLNTQSDLPVEENL